MEREERSEKSTVKDVTEAGREVNKDSVVFLLLLDIG